MLAKFWLRSRFGAGSQSLAASWLMWNGRGSNWAAKALIASASIRTTPRPELLADGETLKVNLRHLPLAVQ
jgi:hypothetical protein